MSTAREHIVEPHLHSREIDPEGEATLEVMSGAPHFNRWMFDTIRPYLTGPVLEIGSGIGNLSEHLLATGMPSVLSDLRSHYCRQLQARFGQHESCTRIQQLNLVDPHFARLHRSLYGSFRSAFALNVVEHIQDDALALANASQLLMPGGQMIILVPAYRLLYNRLDRELGHYRRYTRTSLEQLFVSAGLEVMRSFYFNLAGLPGWFVSGTLLGNPKPHAGLLRLYNQLVWLFRIVDRMTLRRLGLSVVAVGRKPDIVSLPVAA